jgi:hypothetical protein
MGGDDHVPVAGYVRGYVEGPDTRLDLARAWVEPL